MSDLRADLDGMGALASEMSTTSTTTAGYAADFGAGVKTALNVGSTDGASGFQQDSQVFGQTQKADLKAAGDHISSLAHSISAVRQSYYDGEHDKAKLLRSLQSGIDSIGG